MKCFIDGCNRTPTLAPKVMMPARGIPADLHRPAEFLLDVALCSFHFPLAHPRHLLNRTLRNFLDCQDHLFRMPDNTPFGAPPDLDRAWVRAVPISDVEWLMMQDQILHDGEAHCA